MIVSGANMDTTYSVLSLHKSNGHGSAAHRDRTTRKALANVPSLPFALAHSAALIALIVAYTTPGTSPAR